MAAAADTAASGPLRQQLVLEPVAPTTAAPRPHNSSFRSLGARTLYSPPPPEVLQLFTEWPSGDPTPLQELLGAAIDTREDLGVLLVVLDLGGDALTPGPKVRTADSICH